MLTSSFKWSQILSKPSEFFENLKPDMFGTKVLFLGVVCLFVGTVAESGVQLLLLKYIGNWKVLEQMIPSDQIHVVQKQALLNLLFSPASAFFGLYLFASALHFLIRGFVISPKTPLNYETTLGLVALCQLPMLFSMIPLVGPVVASVWVFVLLMRALRQIYGLSSFMAFTCILTPALFLKMTWGSALQLLALSL